jgi:hypothetical protein
VLMSEYLGVTDADIVREYPYLEPYMPIEYQDGSAITAKCAPGCEHRWVRLPFGFFKTFGDVAGQQHERELLDRIFGD